MDALIYARVSSTTERQSTERQILDLKNYAKNNNINIIGVCSEHISGAVKNNERTELLNCITKAEEHEAMILCSELSRWGRNVYEILEAIKYCVDKHINVYFQKENLCLFNVDGSDNPFLAVFVSVLATCASIERENIKFRLNSGRELAIKKGVRMGRKVGSIKSKEQKAVEYQKAIKLLKKGISVRSVAKICDISTSTVQRLKKEFEI